MGPNFTNLSVGDGDCCDVPSGTSESILLGSHCLVVISVLLRSPCLVISD
jgi:hypothetical protein